MSKNRQITSDSKAFSNTKNAADYANSGLGKFVETALMVLTPCPSFPFLLSISYTLPVSPCTGKLLAVLAVDFSKFFPAVDIVVIEFIVLSSQRLLDDCNALHRRGVLDKNAHGLRYLSFFPSEKAFPAFSPRAI